MDSDYSTDSDSEATARDDQFAASSSATATSPLFLIPPRSFGRASVSSTASNTPVPSRANSPLPSYYHHTRNSSSCPSDSDSELHSPLIRNNSSSSRYPWIRENRRSSTWWSAPRRRRNRNGKVVRALKRWMRCVVRHPFFPAQPITLVLALILLSILAIVITLLLIHILNPDKEPLPWRAYCSIPGLAHPLEPHYPGKQRIYPELEPMQMIPPFPPSNLDDLPPAGLFIGVFSIDSASERRMQVRTTWASHPRSRDGAVGGDEGRGTSRTIVRFILGLPRKDWERRVKLEMEMYNDIVILPIPENMNSGKTHSFFSWASLNAWVPPLYTKSEVPLPKFSYSNYTATPPSLAPHDPFAAWENIQSGQVQSWVRPDFVAKVDDDSFVMLAELEARLRVELHQKPKAQNSTLVYRRAAAAAAASSSPSDGESSSSEASSTGSSSTASPTSPEASPPAERDDDEDGTSASPTSKGGSSAGRSSPTPPSTPYPSYPEFVTDNDPLIYWGYLVTNRLHQFMAGELYALSWGLVDWVAKDATVKTLTKGAEDKQTAKWMRAHPRADKVRWSSERCWIYDHPRSATVYSHGFLFPSEVTRIKRSMMAYVEKYMPSALGSSGHSGYGSSRSQPTTPAAWSQSSVANFGVRYTPPVPDLSTRHSVEALVEGSDMSNLREGSPMTAEHAWVHREGRNTRYENKRVGGTVVVHFIKKTMWFYETAMALLEGEEISEAERYEPAPDEELYEESFWSKWSHHNFQGQRQKLLQQHSLLPVQEPEPTQADEKKEQEETDVSP